MRIGRRAVVVLVAMCCGLWAIVATPPAAAGDENGFWCEQGGGPGKRLPVLLVHGFNSSSAAWSVPTREYLAMGGRACIEAFDYAPAATEWVTDPRIGQALAHRIVSLAEASRNGGGPGRVVVVGHSMGGLATRCAADEACSHVSGVAASIRAVITLGTPHLGTTWKGYGRSLATPIIQAAITAACLRTDDLARVASGVCDSSHAFLTSAAARAFTPGSGEQRALSKFPTNMPVMAIAASVKIKTSLFGRLSDTVGDGGDLVVSEDSALDEHQIIDGIGGEKVLDCGSVDVTFYVAAERLCWHGSMTNDLQFRTEVLKVLTRIVRQEPGTIAGAEAVINPVGSWSRRMATLELRSNGVGIVSYRVGKQARGCFAASTSGQDCYFNAEFKLASGAGPYTGSITKVWFTESSISTPTSDYVRDLPKVGASVSLRFDAAPDMAYYQDGHGKIDLCGPNPKVSRQPCS